MTDPLARLQITNTEAPMIIQHPDGSYEVCPLTPALARWLNAQLQQARSLMPVAHIEAFADTECNSCDQAMASSCNNDE
jgi:hypothetical protein